MLRVITEKTLLKRGKPEEIILLADRFRRPSAIRTRIARPRVVHVSVVENAVLAGVLPFVNVLTARSTAIFAAPLEEPLPRVRVLQVGGADELVTLDAEFVPNPAPLAGHFVDEFLWRLARLRCRALDVDAVLVRAGRQHHIESAHALVTANGVAHDRRIRVPDVRQPVRVVDRR